MPLYERNGRKIYFIHPPKTGGMSVRFLLEANGWDKIPEPANLFVGEDVESVTGHMPWRMWKNWEEVQDAEFRFGLVRHPISRAKSLIKMTLAHVFDIEYDVCCRASRRRHRECWIEDDKRAYTFLWFTQTFQRHINMQQEQYADYLPDGKKFDFTDYSLGLLVNLFHQFNLSPQLSDEQRMQLLQAMRSYFGVSWLAQHLNKEWEEVTWADGLIYLFDYYSVDDAAEIFSPGINHSPQYPFLSDSVNTYRLENGLPNLLEDLKKRNIVSLDSEIGHENKSKLEPIEFITCNLDDAPELKTKFLNLYGKDFDLFEYDRNNLNF